MIGEDVHHGQCCVDLEPADDRRLLVDDRLVDTATVLQVLIAEYQTDQHIAAVHDEGLLAVILRDGDYHIVSTELALEPRPFGRGDRQRLAEMLTSREAQRRPRPEQFVWQIWTGDRWQRLGIIDVPHDNATARPDAPGTDPAPSSPNGPSLSPSASDAAPESGHDGHSESD